MTDELTRRAFLLRTLAATGGLLANGNLDLAAMPPAASAHDRELRLWFRRPASQWVEALPLGNGRLGAMLFGGIERERLQLNEDTLWSGGPSDWNNPRAREVLPEVRRLLFAGEFAAAERLTHEMEGPYTESYLPLGDLLLTFEHGDVAQGGYERALDLRRGVARVAYTVGPVGYTREAFISHPDQLLVLRLTADRPGALTFTAALDSLLRHHTAPDGGVLKMKGRAPAHVDPNYYSGPTPFLYNDEEGMAFETHLEARATGGRSWLDADGVHVEAASIGVGQRGFNGFDPQAFTPDATEAQARHSVDAMVAFNRPNAKTHSGIWRDLAVRKRRTEVDVQVLPIVETGAAHGVDCPKCRKLTQMIHEIEDGTRLMTDDNLLELLHA